MSHARAINVFQFRARRAIWPATLLFALLAIAIGGPASCVIHCLRHHPATHPHATIAHQPAHDAHHAAESGVSHAAADTREDQPAPKTLDEPSAVTVGVLLPLVLLPLVIAMSLPPQPRLPPLRDVTLLPPRDPPRLLLAN